MFLNEQSNNIGQTLSLNDILLEDYIDRFYTQKAYNNFVIDISMKEHKALLSENSSVLLEEVENEAKEKSKGFFSKVWEGIKKFFSYIGNLFSKLVNSITSLFTGKKKEELAKPDNKTKIKNFLTKAAPVAAALAFGYVCGKNSDKICNYFSKVTTLIKSKVPSLDDIKRLLRLKKEIKDSTDKNSQAVQNTAKNIQSSGNISDIFDAACKGAKNIYQSIQSINSTIQSSSEAKSKEMNELLHETKDIARMAASAEMGSVNGFKTIFKNVLNYGAAIVAKGLQNKAESNKDEIERTKEQNNLKYFLE